MRARTRWSLSVHVNATYTDAVPPVIPGRLWVASGYMKHFQYAHTDSGGMLDAHNGPSAKICMFLLCLCSYVTVRDCCFDVALCSLFVKCIVKKKKLN